MALQAKLVQKLSQSLTMTPQLQQAIKLLQLGRLEYLEAIEQEMMENPVLEEMREDDASGPKETEILTPELADSYSGNDSGEGDSSDPEARVDWEDYLESFTDYRGASTPKGTVDFEDRPSLENAIHRTESLSEHLAEQIRYLDLSDTERNIALHIVGNLDKDGYLCSSFDELAQECDATVEAIEKVIVELRTIDPVGITARDLKECLLIQLEAMGLAEGIEARIVRDHLDKVEKRRFDQIAKELGVSLEKVGAAVHIIQGLEPRPGRQFADEDIRYIVPDVYVQKINGEYVISLNEDGLPKLRVSPYYLQVLQTDSQEAKSYLNERLKAASWLIKSIHQRQQTIFRVAESIVKFQREFLDQGIDKLKPLVLKDVATDIGMHESTVSRVTSNKYVHTPQGVFELKYFFTTGIKSSSGDMSSSSVKERIKNLILAENDKNPISDQEIVDILKKEQIDIARRTVAKYRESLGIASSAKRKKIF